MLPHWADVRLENVDYAGVSEWVSDLCRKRGRGGESLSPSRVRQAYPLMTGMLDAAVAARWLPANAARGVALPAQEERQDRRALSHDQVVELADGCGPHRLMVLLLAYSGLRWGEVVGSSPRGRAGRCGSATSGGTGSARPPGRSGCPA